MRTTKSHFSAAVRHENKNRVYRYLYALEEPVTKQDLAYSLSMSLPTLTQNLNELLAENLIDNSEIADSTGGRRPRVISLRRDARFAVGIELSRHHIRMVAVDLGVNVLGWRVIDRRFSADGAYAQKLWQDLRAFLEGLALDTDRLLGVGVTLPGIVSSDQAVLEDAHTLDVVRLELGWLAAGSPYPVFFSNDANAGGFAEWWNQDIKGCMIYLSLERGVGGAILMNGTAYLGQRTRAAEFGHMCIHPGGRPCSCGRRGCLEAYCSTARLSDDLGIGLEQFFAGVNAGSRRYTALWDAYLDDLVIGISNIHTAFDSRIVLGGKISKFLLQRFEELDSRLKKADPDYRENEYLSICRYHAQSSGIGAALHFVDQFITEL